LFSIYSRMNDPSTHPPAPQVIHSSC
jgi:hypothetical protein